MVRGSGIDILLWILASAALIFAADVVAHPFHTSTTQLHFNQETRMLEFALRIDPDDLMSIPAVREAKGVPADQNEQQRLVEAYLQQRVGITSGGAVAGNIELIGMETGIDESWVFFQSKLSARAQEFCLNYRIFIDQASGQLNTVSYETTGISRTVILTGERPKSCFVTGYR